MAAKFSGAHQASNPVFPHGLVVVERGWLSSNMVLIPDSESLYVVDTGYIKHSRQTVAIVELAIQSHPLGADASLRILNTHLHSDHCGGNASLQQRFPKATTYVPDASFTDVEFWEPMQASFRAVGQRCERFSANSALSTEEKIKVGASCWSVHGGPGHDPHSVLLFEEVSGTLISADALWQDGFGVVFPEIDGGGGFDEVEATLSLIEALKPSTVIPGHGPAFTDVLQALARARSRLAYFRAQPERHFLHTAKVLIAFKAMDWTDFTQADLLRWAEDTPMLMNIFRQIGSGTFSDWVNQLAKAFVNTQLWTQNDSTYRTSF